jgi:hypothetical protein
MVYSGTYEFNYQGQFTETASYTWTQTQTVSFSATSEDTTMSVTTTFDARGVSALDQPGGIDGSNGLTVSCTIQTPPHYQWVATTLVPRASDNGERPVGFSWSISTPPPPGNPGVTAGPASGPPSGCQSSNLGFVAQLGIPEPSADASQSTLDPSQSRTFGDAEVGNVTLQSDQLPTTRRFDIDATTNTGAMHLHGTLTFSRVS